MNEPTPNIPRLRKLLRAVESAPAEQFDMDEWAKKTACGTTACAWGWYAIANPEEGFQLNFVDSRRYGDVVNEAGILISEVGRCAHFGIRLDDEDELFYLPPDRNYESKEHYLARLRRWLAVHAPAALEPERTPSYTLAPSVLAARANGEHLRAADAEGDAERRGYVDRWADDAGDVLAVAERPSRWEQE